MLCWYCEKAQMAPWEDLGKGWFKCPDCGATWIKPLELAPSVMSFEHDDATGRTKRKSIPLGKKWRPKK